MIELNDLSKIFYNDDEDTHALNKVNLSIDEGEMVAVIGPSGSGKSTLLNIIGGLDKATSGIYRFNDIEVSKLKKNQLHAFRRDNIGFVFQNYELLDDYTVYENVELPLLAKGEKNKKEKILNALSQVNIKELAKKRAKHLSGGQKQRCAIARAIVGNASLILADEPTGALDSRNSNTVFELLEQINKCGKTVIIATHNEQLAQRCGRIISLFDGEIQDN
ncbi:MAG: ABC transporter ATP-binding protein [Lachnospiraceae bacterium]|jgi:putative ABC transport system ATP-binding protein|nr:ABC transporter ATP-binding protein [Lachnospiraceae bacterium]